MLQYRRKSVTEAQRFANRNYRERLSQRGIKRIGIMVLESDCELLRTVARKLREDETETNSVRPAIASAVGEQRQQQYSILDALRASPLVGAELAIDRKRENGRAAR
jgi:predicted ATPase with chaperone activity